MDTTDIPVLYVKAGCPYCQKASKFLNENGISFREREVRHDEDARDELEDISGQAQVPTLNWHGAVLPDFDVDELRSFLREKGISYEES